jgi:hypothetical protein
LNAPGHANGQSAAAQQTVDPAVIAAFAKQLAPGSRVRIRAAGRPTIRGTFMGTTDGQIVVQPRTRIMEPAVEVPIDQVIGIEVEQPNNVGKAIAVGVATGAGVALGVFLLIVAIAVND